MLGSQLFLYSSMQNFVFIPYTLYDVKALKVHESGFEFGTFNSFIFASHNLLSNGDVHKKFPALTKHLRSA